MADNDDGIDDTDYDTDDADDDKIIFKCTFYCC